MGIDPDFLILKLSQLLFSLEQCRMAEETQTSYYHLLAYVILKGLDRII